MNLRKIPLESFIEILQQLYEEGADYVDIIAEETKNNRDVMSIKVRPEYFIHNDKDLNDNREEQFETDHYYEEECDDNLDSAPLSEKDINDLI